MRDREYLEDKEKKITEKEAVELFQTEFNVNLNDFNSYEIQYCNYENDNYKVESEIAGEGGEGQGEEYWKVSRILDKNTNEVFFIRFDGFYTSWDGTDWSNNDYQIVRPREVTVIQWY